MQAETKIIDHVANEVIAYLDKVRIALYPNAYLQLYGSVA